MIHRSIDIPDIYTLVPGQNGGQVLVENSGLIVTKLEWDQIKLQIEDFYALHDFSQIEKHNAPILKSFEDRQLEMGRVNSQHSPVFHIPERLLTLPRFCRIRGWVYWLTAEGREGVKIGETSKNLRQRTKGNAKELQKPVTVIDAIQSNHHKQLEKYLHQHFKSKHISGDWFNLTENDVNDVRVIAYHFNSQMEVSA